MFGQQLMQTTQVPHKMIGGAEVEICAFCCKKQPTQLCGECNEQYCDGCIGPHTCGGRSLFATIRVTFVEELAIHSFGLMLCATCIVENGLASNLICLRGFSKGGGKALLEPCFNFCLPLHFTQLSILVLESPPWTVHHHLLLSSQLHLRRIDAQARKIQQL